MGSNTDILYFIAGLVGPWLWNNGLQLCWLWLLLLVVVVLLDSTGDGRRSIIKGHDGNESRLLLQGLLVVYIREMATRFTRFGLQRSGGIIIVTERRELLN